MARSISEIYNEMVSEKETMTELTSLLPETDNAETLLEDVNSGSKVAKWRLFFWIHAVSIWVHEKLFDTHKAEIEARANELITAVPLWYRDQCFLFQYGHSLAWDGTRYGYETDDPESKIIKRAAVIEAGGQVRIKVAKLVSELPAALSAGELAAFELYINQIKVAGTNVAVISRDADLLKIEYDVYYNELVMTGDGELIDEPGVKPVEDAINSYIQSLPFNGVLSLTKLTDAVQEAQGVVDPILTSAAAKYGALPYSTIERIYVADAGHMKIDPAFPLETQINYIPNV